MNKAEAIAGRGLIQEVEAAYLWDLAKQAPLHGFVVELGTFSGETTSLLCAAVGAERVITIDDYDAPGRQPNLHISEAVARAVLSSRGFEPQVFNADTRQVPKELDGQPIGLLFVDSWHMAAQFSAEMEAWGPLVVPGGIVACHDYGSKKWNQMQSAVDAWAATGPWERIGLARRLVAHRRRA